jgi:hypothetical protein
MKRSWWKVVLLTSALAVLAACTSGQHRSASQLSGLQVHVGLFGGPARPDGGMADSNAPQPNATVTLVNGTGRKWTANTGRDGVASFSVLPGEYSVTSLSCGPQSVTIRASQRAYIQIRCDIP